MAETRTDRRRPCSREDMLAILGEEWLTVHEIAPLIGVTVARVRQVATELLDERAIQKRVILRKDRWHHEYKKAPPGYVEPLYESRVDAWPLAQALGNYTFLSGGCRVA